jgi:methionine-S-sulfoxide reductase
MNQNNNQKTKTAIFAAGCFWNVEEVFDKVEGVVDTEVGYTGGETENPTYAEVCGGNTGHAEAIRVTYDPDRVSYEDLLDTLFETHDPTTLDRQGPDVGRQYRGAIFYMDEEQKESAEKKKTELENSAKYKDPIVTEITPAKEFYRAEEYHQKYFSKQS